MANLAEVLGDLGFRDDAARWYRRALDLEPNYVGGHTRFAIWELLTGSADSARERMARLVEIAPDCPACFSTRGSVELISGNPAAARAAFLRQLSRSGTADYSRLRLAQLDWHGDRGAAERHLEIVVQRAEQRIAAGHERWLWRWNLAIAASIRGRGDEALLWLERAVEQGRRYWYWDSIEPAFEPLRGDPRFQRLVTRMRSAVETMRGRAEAEGVLRQVRGL